MNPYDEEFTVTPRQLATGMHPMPMGSGGEELSAARTVLERARLERQFQQRHKKG